MMMQYLSTLILAIALLMAPAHGTVQTYRAMYRAAPLTSFNAPAVEVTPLHPVTTTPVPPTTTPSSPGAVHQPVAQKREGQSQQFYGYPAVSDQSVPYVAPPVPVQPVTVDHHQQVQQKYPNYYYPQNVGGQLQPMAYQAFDTEGQGQQQTPSQGGAVSNGGSSYLANFPWTDVLVYAAALGLVGSGSAMWYYQVVAKEKSARAMKEFVDQLKSEDTARMARKVFESIKKFSKLNSGDDMQ